MSEFPVSILRRWWGFISTPWSVWRVLRFSWKVHCYTLIIYWIFEFLRFCEFPAKIISTLWSFSEFGVFAISQFYNSSGNLISELRSASWVLSFQFYNFAQKLNCYTSISFLSLAFLRFFFAIFDFPAQFTSTLWSFPSVDFFCDFASFRVNSFLYIHQFLNLRYIFLRFRESSFLHFDHFPEFSLPIFGQIHFYNSASSQSLVFFPILRVARKVHFYTVSVFGVCFLRFTSSGGGSFLYLGQFSEFRFDVARMGRSFLHFCHFPEFELPILRFQGMFISILRPFSWFWFLAILRFRGKLNSTLVSVFWVFAILRFDGPFASTLRSLFCVFLRFCDFFWGGGPFFSTVGRYCVSEIY